MYALVNVMLVPIHCMSKQESFTLLVSDDARHLHLKDVTVQKAAVGNRLACINGNLTVIFNFLHNIDKIPEAEMSAATVTNGNLSCDLFFLMVS